MADSKSVLVGNAQICEAAERWQDMVDCMRSLVQTSGDLSNMERNLLSSAYKNIVGARRSAWRILMAIEQRSEKTDEDEERISAQRKKDLTKEFRRKIEEELVSICTELIDLVANNLQDTNDSEGKVFYLKMKGDYYRYLAEFRGAGYEDKAKMAYEEAMELARDGMSPAHPVRLGLVLNYSVFHFEILQNFEVACALAKEAFDNAIVELDSMKEDTYKDSTIILQLLRDNLALWAMDLERHQQDTD